MRRMVIYVERRLHWGAAKTAIGAIRYRPDEVVCLIDSENAGQTVASALKVDFGYDIPIVGSIDEATLFDPNTLLIGVAPHLPVLSVELKAVVKRAIGMGFDIVNGLHTFMNEEPDIAQLAAQSGSSIIDLRRPPKEWHVFTGKSHPARTCTVLSVGSDCCIGKKTIMLELERFARLRGWNVGFLATGQTGIMIDGKGIPADHIISEFLAGTVEFEVESRLRDVDTLFVEGQGALNHPAGSGVPLALLHGARPDALIVCHDPRATTLSGEQTMPLPSLRRIVEMNEEAASWPFGKPSAKAVGISLITNGMSESAAHEAIDSARAETGLPATDGLRFGVECLLDAVASHVSQQSDAAS